ncbi:GNAT family N-acetyltransferase [Zafaria sp. Z1313]|uniref:GNAT family N-acetyltransferase n=1 Tax=Zafaria sp. Z1313 TaxID=3423202 RepID=UPI003D303336
MALNLDTPAPAALPGIAAELGAWATDDGPIQLHPGDVGWYWRFGAAATAAALRTWSRDGRLLAVGLLDGPGLLRLAIAPDARDDAALAERLALDASTPGAGVLPEGEAFIEAPGGARVREALAASGWREDESWAPLRHDLTAPARDPGLRIEVAGPAQAAERAAVQRASFGGSTFTEARWLAMAAGPLYADARCLLAYDADASLVAGVTVWSAGPGRPGLIEPLGVDAGHRGRGYGTAATRAAVAALRELGSSSALVCTQSANTAAVAAYASAGFRALPEVADLRRDG